MPPTPDLVALAADVEAADSVVVETREREVALEAEAASLNAKRQAAEEARADLVAESGPALRANADTVLTRNAAERRHRDSELEAIAAAIEDCAREHETAVAERHAAEERAVAARRREAEARFLSHIADAVVGLRATGDAFGRAAELGELLGLGHVVSNSILIGAGLWASAPSLARAVEASGRSEARSLTSLFAEVFPDLIRGE